MPPNTLASPLITIIFTGTEVRASREETIRQPNCGGKAEVENEVGRSRSVKYEIEVRHGLTVNANGEVGLAGTGVGLGAAVANELGLTYGVEEIINRNLTVKASPGTNMIHQIKLEEVWQTGTAKIIFDGKEVSEPFTFRYDFSVQLIDSYDREDCDSLLEEPPAEPDSQSLPCDFPQIGLTPPKLLLNGEWIYSCLSTGENNWVGQEESWKAVNWKRGSGQSEIVNILIPEGASRMGIGCNPCTIVKPDGSTVSSIASDYGRFQPNIEFSVVPGELHKVKIFGADSCPTRPGVIPPCAPEIYIWFNLETYTSPNIDICQDISKYPGIISSMPGIPAGNSMTIRVQNGEIHAMTAGAISVAGVSLPGGRDRGGVVILLPSAIYSITDLHPTYNWHGVFRLEPNEWASLADVLAAQQMIPGTCVATEGCAFVDVLVVGPNGVIAQYEKRGPSAVNCSP
jgi:hypothetical protein